MQTTHLYSELQDLINNVASLTDNYYRSGNVILTRQEVPLALITDEALYAGYYPLDQKRMMEIDILRRVYPSVVTVVPYTLLDEGLLGDDDFVGVQWYQFMYFLMEEYNKKDAVKKKVLFHLKKFVDLYVIYYMLKGTRTPEKAASFLNTFVDFTIMQEEVDSIEAAAKIKRINEFYEYDLSEWREFNKDRVNNESGHLFFRYIASEKAFEETSGFKVHQKELRRFWNQYLATGISAISVFAPACEMPRLLSVNLTRDGNLMIDGQILTAEELDSALMQITD